MKYRNYFIMFCVGFAFAVSMLSFEMAVFNYLLFTVPAVVLMVFYFIAILKDTLK
jgi:hypothetical protein